MAWRTFSGRKSSPSAAAGKRSAGRLVDRLPDGRERRRFGYGTARRAFDCRTGCLLSGLTCRFPRSQDPLAHCDVHHIVERAHRGGHNPDNLIMLSRRYHTRVHHHHWRLKLNPTTGEVVATRGKRRWRSLPRGTPLNRPPPAHAGDEPADHSDPTPAPPDTGISERNLPF